MSDTIYISEYLTKIDRGKRVVQQIRALTDAAILVSYIPANKNEWCRDYMPVRSADGRLVLFNYRPPYLVGSKSGEATIPNQKEICSLLNLDIVDATTITLDGGAIEIYNGIGIVSSKFVALNGESNEVVEAIKDLLNLCKLIVLPPDPWDFTGHVDGLIRFINDDTVLMNDYSKMDELIRKESKYIQKKYFTWKEQLLQAISDAGLNIEYLVSAFHLNGNATTAKGIYLNFLNLKEYIIMPTFQSLPEYNNAAKERLSDLYNKSVLCIEADGIAQKGGIINCITWST